MRGLPVLLGVLCTLGCPRPPVDPGNDGGAAAGRLSVDFLEFVQDRPAVGGDWYLYQEEAGHLLEPYDHVYVVKSGPVGTPTYAAIRLVSYYDPDTAESGRFSVRVGRWERTAWSPTEAVLLSTNIKADGPACLDLNGPTLEVPCAENGWQVMLRAYPFLAREGPIVVARPGLFVRSVATTSDYGTARVATLEGRSSLDDLPDPTTIADLDDTTPDDWDAPSYPLNRYAASLPRAGMTLGTRFLDPDFTGRDDVFFLVNAFRSIIRFQVRPNVDGAANTGQQFTWSRDAIDLDDNTIAEEPSALLMADIAVPDVGETTFLSFEADDLVMDAQYLDGASWPHLPPNERRWDLALSHLVDGEVRLLLSPASAIYNASAFGDDVNLNTARPPR